MMPDRDAANAQAELDLALLVGRIGATYTKQQLSPPFNLRDAVKHWRGLSPDEIVEILADHFDRNRHMYTCGAGEQQFGAVHEAMRKALESKRPAPDRAVAEAERPQRPRRRVVTLHNPSGVNDVYEEGAAGSVREPEGPIIERPAALPGYEQAGEPIEGDA